MIKHGRLAALAALLLAAVPPPAWGAGLEDQLNSRWRGAYAVARLPVVSSCDGFYNDNNVVGDRVDSKARRRFEAGELARVERVGAHRGRIDVFLDLAEQVLDELRDGPFTLYEPRSCKIQLRVPVPDRWTPEQVEARLGELLERHDSVRSAEASKTWNGRRRDPFPEGYEQTLADYKAWKAQQANAAVQVRMEGAIEEASRMSERVRSDPEYLEGFAAGIDEVRDRSFGDCAALAHATFSTDSRSGKSSDWRRGYEDGQRLGFNLELLRRLKECFVPVPPG
jgi:hypothetical protein